MIAGLQRMGCDVGELVPETAPGRSQGVYEVWEENWVSLDFFLDVQSQWVWSGGLNAQRTGLNYAGCESAARGLGLKWRERLPDLKLMERAVLQGEHEARLRAAEQG